ncbi:hypothetical protein HK107_08850 [Parvularcula sp. ZS-1/3]|uniref:Uncharacterized protein n=1 Tax=Parvularcula mediterranea TaxID=2732508 RepID=A0A7Y3RLR9_9PROT|nr:hypothetical protein [Parvularcula mediterranea]NNU16427.1 hypothetical protein [Parvularcula mediterranea]
MAASKPSKRLGSESIEPMVTERFYDRELNSRERAVRGLRATLQGFLKALALAGIMLPLQLFGILTLDLPLSLFDAFAPTQGLRPSAWMSLGEGLLMLLVLLTILMTRRWGAGAVAGSALLGWALTFSIITMLIVELAPELQDGDFPSGRFISVLIISWVAGQLFAGRVFDITRGGNWWKAPFFGAAFGYGFQALIYFPGAFAGTGAPWLWWMLIYLVITTAISLAFVLIYGPLRRLIVPKAGLGGRFD